MGAGGGEVLMEYESNRIPRDKVFEGVEAFAVLVAVCTVVGAKINWRCEPCDYTGLSGDASEWQSTAGSGWREDVPLSAQRGSSRPHRLWRSRRRQRSALRFNWLVRGHGETGWLFCRIVSGLLLGQGPDEGLKSCSENAGANSVA